MPLDPDIATLLPRVRRAGRPPIETMSPVAARVAYRKALRVLDIAPRPLPVLRTAFAMPSKTEFSL